MSGLPYDIKQVLAQAGIQNGMHIVEFGVGRQAQIALYLSRKVGGDGQVYAVDILPNDLETLRKHCADQQMHNVKTVHGDFERIGGIDISDNSIDIIVSAHNAWRVNDFSIILKEAQRLLKPAGKILLIDWQKNTKNPISSESLQRLDLLEAQRICAASGCDRIEKVLSSVHNWGLILHY